MSRRQWDRWIACGQNWFRIVTRSDLSRLAKYKRLTHVLRRRHHKLRYHSLHYQDLEQRALFSAAPLAEGAGSGTDQRASAQLASASGVGSGSTSRRHFHSGGTTLQNPPVTNTYDGNYEFSQPVTVEGGSVVLSDPTGKIIFDGPISSPDDSDLTIDAKAVEFKGDVTLKALSVTTHEPFVFDHAMTATGTNSTGNITIIVLQNQHAPAKKGASLKLLSGAELDAAHSIKLFSYKRVSIDAGSTVKAPTVTITSNRNYHAQYDHAISRIDVDGTIRSPSITVQGGGKDSLYIDEGGAAGTDSGTTISGFGLADPIVYSGVQPTIVSNLSLPSIDQGEENNYGTLISSLIASSISGLQGTSDLLPGIAIIGPGADGDWQYLNDGVWTDFSSTNNGLGPSEASPLLLQHDDQIRFEPNQGFSGTSTIAFRAWEPSITGSHHSKPAVSAGTANLSIVVIAPPSFTAGGNRSALVSAGPQSVGWAKDIRAGGDSNPDLKFIVTTDNNALFSVLPEINAATGTLTYTPAPGGSGTAQVGVQLDDLNGGGQDASATQTFTITVFPANFVNQPPSFTAGQDEPVAENSGPQTFTGWATNVSAGPPNQSQETVEFNVSTDNDALFSVLPTIDPTGTLTFTPALGVSGTANGGRDTSPTQTFTITVQAGTGTPSQLYVEAVFLNVLGRSVDSSGLQFWTQQIASGVAVSSVAQDIVHSAEYFGKYVVEPAFLKLLNRQADSSGLAYWTGQLQNGLTDQQLEAGFISSAEFYADAGGTNADWINQAYMLLLGRPADPEGESFFNGELMDGMTLLQVATGIAGSTENNTNLINGDYEQYLGRPADSAGLTYWLQEFATGMTNEDVIAGFTGSGEYYDKVTGILSS